MPLVYKIDILPALKDKGYSSARLRKEKLLAEATIQNLRGSKPISWANIEKLCEVLECQPGDLLKFVPKSEPTAEEQFCARLSPSVRAGKLNFGKIKNLNPYPGLLWLSQFPKANLIQEDEKEDCVRYKKQRNRKGRTIMVIIGLIVVVVALVLQAFAANKMQEIAEKKGSDESFWAWCFWLPVIGYAMVIALPNSKQTRYQEEIVQLLRENNELLKKEHSKPIEKQQQSEEKQPIQTPVPKVPTTTVSEYEIMRRKRKAEEEAKRTLASHNLIECPSCGTVQRRDRDVCFECGMSLKQML